MHKVYKLSAFSLFYIALAVIFTGMIFAYSYMTVPANTPLSDSVAMGRIIFMSRCFDVSILIMLAGNFVLGYTILKKLENNNN